VAAPPRRAGGRKAWPTHTGPSWPFVFCSRSFFCWFKRERPTRRPSALPEGCGQPRPPSTIRWPAMLALTLGLCGAWASGLAPACSPAAGRRTTPGRTQLAAFRVWALEPQRQKKPGWWRCGRRSRPFPAPPGQRSFKPIIHCTDTKPVQHLFAARPPWRVPRAGAAIPSRTHGPDAAARRVQARRAARPPPLGSPKSGGPGRLSGAHSVGALAAVGSIGPGLRSPGETIQGVGRCSVGRLKQGFLALGARRVPDPTGNDELTVIGWASVRPSFRPADTKPAPVAKRSPVRL